MKPWPGRLRRSHKHVTKMADIGVTPEGLILQEVAPGLTADDIQRYANAKLHIGAALKVMEG